MKILRSVAAMQALSLRLHRQGRTLGFVPTMGALHEGHLSLVRKAARENDRTAVSIFVNPLQFGPREDFRRYPRPAAKDDRLCRRAGVDFLFRPEARAIYPEGYCTTVEVRGLGDGLCGAFRPGHFPGVATVVLKLLEAVRPDRAYFGEKDYQQLVVIRRMVRDLGLPVRIAACPTVRAPDGLALSSRNAYLSREERRHAPLLRQALALGARLGREGKAGVAAARRAMREILRRIPGARVDYVEIVDARTLAPARAFHGRLRIAAAVRVGRARLIDNLGLVCKD